MDEQARKDYEYLISSRQESIQRIDKAIESSKNSLKEIRKQFKHEVNILKSLRELKAFNQARLERLTQELNEEK